MIPSTTSTSQITPLAPARLTTDRETHRSARNSTTHVELKRLTDRKLRVFANLTPRSLLFPLGCEWELRKKVLRTKHHTNRFAVFFASLRLCVSHPHPSHGHRGPCYGAMLRGHATGPCYGAMLRGHATGPCYGAMPRKGLAPLLSKGTICCSKIKSSGYQSISRLDGIVIMPTRIMPTRAGRLDQGSTGWPPAGGGGS
jgi:hypothetical protein